MSSELILLGLLVVPPLAIVAARILFPLPSLENRTASRALAGSRETTIGRMLLPPAERHPEKSGLKPLTTGVDAFAARVLLAQAAERTLDVQYYIWRRDLTGILLMGALKDAADRGVRVRLLLDDTGTSGMDDHLAALDAHPAVEIRLFNPFPLRTFRYAAYLFDFFRLNRRMHNKSFTADGVATIVGGRNVGDEYFGTGPQPLFVDLDVVAVGAVVPHVTADFDRYWSSASAYPVDRLLAAGTEAGLAAFAAEVASASKSTRFATYARTVRDSDVVRDMADHELSLLWCDVVMISDDPRKALDRAPRGKLMIHHLTDLLGRPDVVLDVVSSYFVPGRRGSRRFATLARAGVTVRVLTNALETTDVVPVHAGYAKYRKRLLRAGVELYELKSSAAPNEKALLGITGSSGASLHAKIFAVDRERMFIGSFNLDPRSALLNTEMGFIVESPILAGAASDFFDERLKTLAYRTEMAGNGDLTWLERREDGTSIRHEHEPGASARRRMLVTLVGRLPVEWLL
ncbi:MAG: phospholipase D family protein [Geminicoccaceae bacterium]|nr:phospholipase D family protein [Geminicoccaceae bacterium]